MKLAIMQPYLFPYIGYFQLINIVDKFILLDDVTLIKQGWINRNNILLNGGSHLFSVPLKKVSSNKLIRDIELSDDTKWKQSLKAKIHQAYNKAPNYQTVFPVVEKIIDYPTQNISPLVLFSLKMILELLNITISIEPTSSIYEKNNLRGENRIIDICIKEKVTQYYNPIGGIDLYSKEHFRTHGIEIHFVETSQNIRYKQWGDDYISNLSIIDVLMFNSIEEIHRMLQEYELK